MDYAALYQKKLTSAAEAVKVVKSGDWVDYGWCTNHPYTLDKALAARQNELKDVKVRGGVTMWMPEICKAEDAGEHFTWNSWHCSGIDRKIISKGMGYFIPMRYSELPRFYRDGNATVDVAMIQVTPMDKHGNFSYALACSHLADMLDAAKTVIVEVNENLPWVYGLTGCEINIKDVDMVVEGENPPVAQLGAGGAPTAVDTAVANLVVPEIPNGACLQLGIGGMPTVLGKLLARSGLHDLGMHTELCSDAYLDLYEAGVLTNRRCTLHRGQGMLGIVLGSKRLYDWVDDNPGVIAAPLSYVNAPEVIAQLDNMVSINSCIAADLYGQVASESSGLRQISGTGGQLDFLTGAAMARGGKAFICMTSTFTDKQGVRHSRILPHFGGDIVTSPRSQAYYLATEYGVVNLAGRSTWERAEALVSIAHPDFREQLIAAAESQKIWRRSARR